MVNTTIQIKRSGSTATPSNLANGELAFSLVSNTLFIGDPTGNAITLVSNAVFGAANIANSANALAQSAFTEANAAYLLANTANNAAANAFPTSGGTITGNVVITGNLTVQGLFAANVDGGTF